MDDRSEAFLENLSCRSEKWIQMLFLGIPDRKCFTANGTTAIGIGGGQLHPLAGAAYSRSTIAKGCQSTVK